MIMNWKLSGNAEINMAAESGNARAAFGQQVLDYVFCKETGKSEEDKAKYAQRIYAKIRAGKKLTPAELDFLSRTDPIMYAKALRAQMMRQALENRLKACRSKQEAEAAYQLAMCSISEKDPDREMLTAALTDAYKEFKESGEYERLPEKIEKEENRNSNGIEMPIGEVQYIVNGNGYQETYKETEKESSFFAQT